MLRFLNFQNNLLKMKMFVKFPSPCHNPFWKCMRKKRWKIIESGTISNYNAIEERPYF